MSSNDWYNFYEFDTEDGTIYCYKKVVNQYDYNTADLTMNDNLDDMYELFTGIKCHVIDYYDSPHGRQDYYFSLVFEDTECRYKVGTYDVFDYRTARYKNANYSFRVLTPKEFVEKVKPLIKEKEQLKLKVKNQIAEKSKKYLKEKEKYLEEQEKIYLSRRNDLTEADKILKLFMNFGKK